MRRVIIPVFLFLITASPLLHGADKIALEPYTYHENFETRELQAWASYPLWQDTAYDPNFRVNTIVPGDSNISIVQVVTPYTAVDNYAGAQKKLDMYLVKNSVIKLRFYLKTHLPVEFLKIRLAAGAEGKIDYTILLPGTNRWVWVNFSFEDIQSQAPQLENRDRLKIYGIAVLAKIQDADPAMPIYFGLDDISIQGARAAHFRFEQPAVYKLTEFAPNIPAQHFQQGELFSLKGTWPFLCEKTTLKIYRFTDATKTVFSQNLSKEKNTWKTAFPLNFEEGLYSAELKAYKGKDILSETEFTLFIAPKNVAGSHPRLWFDDEEKTRIVDRLNSGRFSSVKQEILSKAKETRDKNPIEKIYFEMDQFPDDEPLIGNVPRTLYPWFDRINVWRDGVYFNSLAFALLNDAEAGYYARQLMVKLSGFPFWVHPWFEKRGRHIYYPVGEFGMDMALGYDLLFDELADEERALIRSALLKNIVTACHKGYVEDNLVTSNTSNWIAHITGGSIMSLAAMYGDDPALESLEPFFTGAILKNSAFIQHAFGSDGAYGEGYGYYNFTMLSLSKCLPALERVFKIDLSRKIRHSYRELFWASLPDQKQTCYFGDSRGELLPLTNWAWLLPKNNDPLLGWYYNFLKNEETFMDVLYETSDVPKHHPEEENPIQLFRDVGTTVFRSGWDKDDFIFVMRTGAFFNHQHLDQGTFWLADQGKIFIGERTGSTYYDDPFYQSHYTQPIAHSTILINGNHQSQRTGDPLDFIRGFDDHAFIYHSLDGTDAAFTCGDISRLYWDNVKSLRRNVLYLKPRAILLMDVVEPNGTDVDVSLLFQTINLEDIVPGKSQSVIEKNGQQLTIRHLSPGNLFVGAEPMPHFIHTYKNESPLKTEGRLKITARTNAEPLVFANLLTTDSDRTKIDVLSKNDNFISGDYAGKSFAFGTIPGAQYTVGQIETNALAITWDRDKIFAALCTSLIKNEKMLVTSTAPLTCEITKNRMKYFLAEPADVSIGTPVKPKKVLLNGSAIDFKFNSKTNLIFLKLQAGSGEIAF